MRSKAISMALLAFAFGAQAAFVSQEDAKTAALGWASEGGHLGARIGRIVESAATHSTTNGAIFHSVKMFGGGTVFMSGDDDMPPVIAFTDSTNDFSKIDKKNPLWVLLNRDISARRTAKAETPSIVAAVGEASAASSSQWAILRARGQSLSGMFLARYASPRPSTPGDLRVDKLLQSTWDQGDAGGGYNISDETACYNFFTPQDDSGSIFEGKKENVVCGCVATAMSQIMFYHKYPESATVPDVIDTCWFDNTELQLPVSGESYNWAAMEASPSRQSSEEARRAIGLLTSDAGRSVGMSYSADESGSFTFKASKMLCDVFKFGQSVCLMGSSSVSTVGSLTEERTLAKFLFTNLDAGYPVMLGISGDTAGGHEICADGYGYHNGTPYVHLNMGWSGSSDIWYNLPNIEYSSSSAFTSVDDAVYNIIPDCAGKGIVSGRVVDEDGRALALAKVSVYEAGSDVLVTQLITSAFGVWGVALPQGTYDFAMSDAEGERSSELSGVKVSAPVQTEVDIRWEANTPEGYEQGKWPMVTSKVNIGNSWGNDVELRYPRIRIVTSGGETNVYSSLDRAIAAARTFAGSGQTPVMEILRDASLDGDATIDFDCTLCAATGDESATFVARPTRATLTVASGCTFTASNCVFESVGSVPLIVKAGGKVVVGPGFSADRVAAEDAGGFNVLGYISSDILVECASAVEVGDVFGFATTDDPVALSNSVTKLYAAFDNDREVRGALQEVAPGEYLLVWGESSVPVDSAVGYFVTSDGTTNASAKLNRLFAKFENSLTLGLFSGVPEIVLIKNDDEGLSRDILVSSPLVIRGEGNAALKPSQDAHIIVTNGGSLVIKNLIIADRRGDTFLKVYDASSVVLSSGAKLSNLVCTGNDDLKKAGPVAVFAGGSLRLEGGASIVGCSAIGSSLGGQHGGGVYLYEGGTIDLAGGDITQCSSANGFGGGVYASSGSSVIVSGPSRVIDNVNKNGKADDLYLYSSNVGNDIIAVTNSVVGGSIGVRYSTGTGNAVGAVFADASQLSSAHDIEASADAFFNDANADRFAEAEGADIMWAEATGGAAMLQPLDPNDAAAMAYAVAKVDYPAGFDVWGSTAYWSSAQDAFASLDKASGEATVTLLQNDWYDTNLVVNCSVVFQSDNGALFVLSRVGDSSVIVNEGASLAVADISVVGQSRRSSDRPCFEVSGGSLTLDGATISSVTADGPIGAAINATAGAEVKLCNGATIEECSNLYSAEVGSLPSAGAICISDEGSKLILEDSTISNCKAEYVGGISVINGAVIEVSQEAKVSGNTDEEGDDSNMLVSYTSSLVLADVLTGEIGVGRDVSQSLSIFGIVDEAFSGSDDELISSAMKFESDDGEGYGVPVRSESGSTLLAWSGRLSSDGSYTDSEGEVYESIKGVSVAYPIDAPEAVAGLVYNGNELIGVTEGRGYTLAGEYAATTAGVYTAIAKLSDGYVWSDGNSDDKEIVWVIEKASLDMGDISFPDTTFIYDGTPKTITIEGTLMQGIKVVYAGGGNVLPGEYTLTAMFVVDSDNYNPVSSLTAKMTILRPVAVPTAASLVYNAEVQTAIVEGEYYSLSGDVAGKDAQTNYVAVATLEDYCVWDDGNYSAGPLNIEWSIAPAPLEVSAVAAQKKVGESDPAAFAYTVEGVQGTDDVANIFTGALVRDSGEDVGVYAIRLGTLAIAKDERNYVISSYKMAFFRITTEGGAGDLLPELPDDATASDVAEALDDAGLADPAVADAINSADDPVAAYEDFVEWAQSLDGGVEGVVDSPHAWDSYSFGVEELFENEPTVEFTSIAVENASDASMRVTFTVKDGGVEKAVSAEKVADMFEISTDFTTWTDDVSVTINGDGSFTVKPSDPALTSAFIRIKN